MRLNRGGQIEARAQGKGPQVKCICIKGLKILPLGRNSRRKYGRLKGAFSASLLGFGLRKTIQVLSSVKFQKMLTSKKYPLPSHTPKKNIYQTHF
jgi:hypothetical protein